MAPLSCEINDPHRFEREASGLARQWLSWYGNLGWYEVKSPIAFGLKFKQRRTYKFLWQTVFVSFHTEVNPLPRAEYYTRGLHWLDFGAFTLRLSLNAQIYLCVVVYLRRYILSRDQRGHRHRH